MKRRLSWGLRDHGHAHRVHPTCAYTLLLKSESTACPGTPRAPVTHGKCRRSPITPSRVMPVPRASRITPSLAPT